MCVLGHQQRLNKREKVPRVVRADAKLNRLSDQELPLAIKQYEVFGLYRALHEITSVEYAGNTMNIFLIAYMKHPGRCNDMRFNGRPAGAVLRRMRTVSAPSQFPNDFGHEP
eukprot:429080-Amphidinium_carterae.1